MRKVQRVIRQLRAADEGNGNAQLALLLKQRTHAVDGDERVRVIVAQFLAPDEQSRFLWSGRSV